MNLPKINSESYKTLERHLLTPVNAEEPEVIPVPLAGFLGESTSGAKRSASRLSLIKCRVFRTTISIIVDGPEVFI